MGRFEVNNEYELGNAIWSAIEGDTIVLNKGTYGYVPVKYGVNYEFIDASCAQLIGYGVLMNGDWSAGAIKFNGKTEIINPKIQNSNIKLYYLFQKKLPFNSRFERRVQFIHANGVIIDFLGNDRDNFEFGNIGQNGEDQLPKAIINIIVPSLESSDYEINAENLSKMTIGDFNTFKTQESIENYSIGLDLSDYEYKALWAVNTFIKEYCRLYDLPKIKGYDILEFSDGLGFGFCEKLEDFSHFFGQAVVGKFTNIPLDEDEIIKISNRFLSFQEYSISEYTIYHLNHLNYSIATLGMYQEFEALWVNTSPSIYKSVNPNKKDKWEFIEYIINDKDIKKYLAEMINARNWIIHSKKMITQNNSIESNKLKTEWTAEILNEYQIYALKRPFYWFKALNDFKIEFEKKFPS